MRTDPFYNRVGKLFLRRPRHPWQFLARVARGNLASGENPFSTRIENGRCVDFSRNLAPIGSTGPCSSAISTRPGAGHPRSEEHTSELQSPYVISYAVFCLKKK